MTSRQSQRLLDAPFTTEKMRAIFGRVARALVARRS